MEQEGSVMLGASITRPRSEYKKCGLVSNKDATNLPLRETDFEEISMKKN